MALRDYIFNNFRWKFAALLLATVAWFILKNFIAKGPNLPLGVGAPIPRTFARQPIAVLMNPGDGRRFKIYPSETDVTVLVDRGVLEGLTAREIFVFVNLTDMGDVPSVLRDVIVRTPRGVWVDRLDPIAVRVERIPAP